MAQVTTNNVKSFFKILTEDLESDDATRISSAKIQRLFENPATAPFLTEFVKNVTKENVIANEQLEAYEKVETQGQIKTGDDLKRAIALNEKLNEGYDEEKIELDRKIRKAKMKKKQMEYQLFKIEQMKRKEQQRLDGYEEYAKESVHELREKKNETVATSEQISKTIKNLNTVFQNLCNIFEKTDENYLPSLTDLQYLIQAEEKYNTQLTSFVKKQFFAISKSIEKDLSEHETSYEICRLNDKTLFSGESEVVKKKIAAELKRVELGYPDREKAIISANAQESAAEATLSFLRQKKSNLQQNTFASSSEELRQSYEQTTQKTKDIKEEINQLSNLKIPQLIAENAPLQTTYLLTGDYRRKITRQEFFIERQNKVISLLQQQQARLDLLWKLLTVEEAGHQKTGEQIPILLNELHSMLDDGAIQTEWLEANAQKNENSKPRSVFDEKDEVAISTFKIFGEKEDDDHNSTLFRHFDSLPDAAEALRKRLDNGRKVVTASPNPDEVSLNELCDAMSKCESLLRTHEQCERGDNTDIVLTPEAVTNMTNRLQAEFDHLSELVLQGSKELDKKKNFLEYNKRTAEARTMWVKFNLQPNQLLQQLGEST